jgi:hypothetical protein
MNNFPFRYEFKYWIGSWDLLNIERELKFHGMALDPYNASLGGISWVTSLYFDSYDFNDYQEKCAGLIKRKKIRARIYEPYLNNSQTVWLELKKKHDVKVSKTRLKLNRNEWDSFSNRGVSALLSFNKNEAENKAKQEIAWNIINFSAKPQILIRYRRKSYVTPSSNLRITFDTNLEACRVADLRYNGFMVDAETENDIILEIKSNSPLPSWLGDIIKKYDLKKEAISKYARGVEAVFRYNPLPR